jgi:hypothetical protein
MPQLITISNPCPKCRAEFEAQRTEYCREFLRYQRENFAQRAEFNEDRKKREKEILRHLTQVNALWTSNKSLEAELKHALEKLLKAERECIQAWKISQRKPLTDESIWQIATDCTIGGDLHADKFARAIEAAHGIKEESKCSQA